MREVAMPLPGSLSSVKGYLSFNPYLLLKKVIMKTRLRNKILAAGFLIFLLSPPALNAQLDQVFKNVFNGILGENGALALVPINSPNVPDSITHRDHFRPAANAANDALVPALNNLIANNVSSFPLSSTSVGLSFDWSTGEPISITESLGPIFAERGRTLGKGKVNFGMNYSHLKLSKFRGIRTEDIKFTFTHQDIGPPGLGGISTESDVMDIFLDLHVNSNIFAFYATVGLAENLDFSIALPVVNINLNGNARAVIYSFTHAHDGAADHHFGNVGEEIDNPKLEYVQDYDGSAFGIGDLALRLKYAPFQGGGVDLAVLLDARLHSGKEEDFLGTGKASIRLLGIASKKFGDFTPHINAGYDYRRADFDSDELEFAVGFDHKITRGFTFAMDVLGEVDLNKNEILSFQYSKEEFVITDHVETETGEMGTLIRTIDQTNIPVRPDDNVYNAAIGLRYAPVENMILLGNILLPLNDGGLRSDVAYTVGFAVSL